MKNALELLAPAGDINSFKAAVNNGANAVYLGMPNFNARLKATNFDYDTLKECIEYAHFFNCKVYVTLNTLVSDIEVRSAVKEAESAISLGVDAFIVQDLALVAILKKLYRNIDIHLSTQAGIHNLAGAQVAEKLGVSRVVLSRETKLKDIREIKQNTNLEIEYFVQGALCVCFSGNCYLSAFEHGMSGNRGLCKQLCRLPYTYSLGGQTEKGYMLSAKDLCLLKNIKELVDAGVTSFKIEGRMRRDTYVAEAVNAYRKAIDGVLNKKDEEFYTKKLKVQFNREYLTRAYLDEGVQPVINKKTANHIGVEIGTVESVKPFKNIYSVIIKSNTEINKGDGLKFFLNGKEAASLGVGTVNNKGNGKYEIITNKIVKPSMKVNLIDDKARGDVLLNKKPKKFVDIKVQALKDDTLKVWAKTDSLELYKEDYEPLQAAQKAPISQDDFMQVFSKVADTGFSLRNIDVTTDGVFIMRSKLNEFRRELYEELRNMVIEDNTNIQEPSEIHDKIISMLNTESAFNNKILQDKHGVMQNKGKSEKELFYVYPGSKLIELNKFMVAVLCPNNYTEMTIRQMASELLGHENIALLLPSIATHEDIAYIDKLLYNVKDIINSLVIDNLYGLKYLGDFNIYAGQGLNVYNNYAAQVLMNLGVDGIQPSFESQSDLTYGAMEVENYKLPLMTFAHCPYQTMTGCTCKTCQYKTGLMLRGDRANYSVNRYRLSQCYFKLYKE